MIARRLTVRTRHDRRRGHSRTRLAALGCAALLLALLATLLIQPHTASAQSAPQLWLPTPPGERWRIIQGYGCGTHNGWDRYSLDLASVDGSTYGAPMRAAADGTVFVWVAGSGTLILKHNDGFYTQYTHLQSVVATQRGHAFKRGDVIGAAGDRGSPGIPHLHFTAFTATGAWANNRQSVPLVFAEGYHLPEIGGCNQHGGMIVIADPTAEIAESGINFTTYLETNRWYGGDIEITFSGLDMIRGFSYAWNEEPGDAAPMFTERSGTLRLSEAGEGMHTLFVRGWGMDGRTTVVTYGPFGYDHTPPGTAAALNIDSFAAPANKPSVLSWKPAQDNASGVAGYRVYLGPDPQGTSEWYVETNEVSTAPLGVGTYILRVQAIDIAGNKGEWATLGEIVVTE